MGDIIEVRMRTTEVPRYFFNGISRDHLDLYVAQICHDMRVKAVALLGILAQDVAFEGQCTISRGNLSKGKAFVGFVSYCINNPAHAVSQYRRTIPEITHESPVLV